ncbi:MAG: DUF3187 family protein [Proteobacteria bacterium]|nr:DUF3187 family protein [Pseudomonadota bacterium]
MISRLPAALFSLLISFSAAGADLFAPYSTSNLNPFVRAAGIPSPLTLPGKETVLLQVGVDLANNFTRSSSRNESIIVDGETLQTTLGAAWRFSDRWVAAVDLPYFHHDGGSLDHFIENWHDLFGLPGGGRKSYPANQLRYAYARNNTTLVDLQQQRSGVGDVRLTLGYLVASSNQRQWTLQAGIKLPTGDPEKLTGSGGTDGFVAIQVSQSELFGRQHLRLHSSLGILRPGENDSAGDLLPGMIRDTVFFGSTTLAWRFHERVSLKTQLDYHSALFDSSLRELGDTAAQLVLGGSVKLGNRTQLDVAGSEDIITDTSPDVAILLRLRHSLPSP